MLPGLNVSEAGSILELCVTPPAAVRKPLAILQHEINIVERIRH